MGPAGAGKTTLLKALNGYTPPNAGQVLFNGEDLYANQEQFRLQIGYVPQDDILHPQLTVKEALYYTARLRTDLRDDEIEARIQQVLQDLEYRRHRRPADRLARAQGDQRRPAQARQHRDGAAERSERRCSSTSRRRACRRTTPRRSFASSAISPTAARRSSDHPPAERRTSSRTSTR